MPASAASRVGRLHGFRVAQRNGQDRGVGGEPMHDLGQRVMSLGEIAKLHVKLFSLRSHAESIIPAAGSREASQPGILACATFVTKP